MTDLHASDLARIYPKPTPRVIAKARPELDSAPLFSDRLVCALRRDHPGAKRKLTLKAFLGLRHVAVSHVDFTDVTHNRPNAARWSAH